MAREDLLGKQFGRLTVVQPAENRNGRVAWLCRCECGTMKIATAKTLKKGSTASCGCLRRERSAAMGADRDYIAIRSELLLRHGNAKRGARTPEYMTWLRMKKRCDSPSDKSFPNYGGRGIKVCPRWDESFEAFLADMGPRPTIAHQIDRLDPNGPYSPENCRWVTPYVQVTENRRDLIECTVDGIEFPNLAAATRHFGVVNSTTAFNRLKNGYSIDEAVRAPLRQLSRKRPRESYLPKSKR